MIVEKDQTEWLQQSVLQAIETETPLQIVAGSSKSFYGRATQGKILSTKEHQGIINYQPSELILTARVGTALSDIENILAENDQMLAFEPPYFSPSATLGGVIASGFSGARRPFTGSVRDFVLGCKIISGKAEVLSFGGEVMKNVAGYDVSRLMVGAMGTLGVLLEVSIKVLPKPILESTRVFELNTADALLQMTAFQKKSQLLSGLSFDGNQLYVRFSGTEKAVYAVSQKVGGEELADTENFWSSCNEHQHDFFKSDIDLWRLSIPPSTPELALPGNWFYEWGGAQRWLKTADVNHQQIFSSAESANGHATLFRTKDRSLDLFQPLPDTLKKLNWNIKSAFDPKGIFNPQRLSKDW